MQLNGLSKVWKNTKYWEEGPEQGEGGRRIKLASESKHKDVVRDVQGKSSIDPLVTLQS